MEKASSNFSTSELQDVLMLGFCFHFPFLASVNYYGFRAEYIRNLRAKNKLVQGKEISFFSPEVPLILT